MSKERNDALDDAIKCVKNEISRCQELANFDPNDFTDGGQGSRLRFAILGRIDGLAALVDCIHNLKSFTNKNTLELIRKALCCPDGCAREDDCWNNNKKEPGGGRRLKQADAVMLALFSKE